VCVETVDRLRRRRLLDACHANRCISGRAIKGGSTIRGTIVAELRSFDNRQGLTRWRGAGCVKNLLEQATRGLPTMSCLVTQTLSCYLLTDPVTVLDRINRLTQRKQRLFEGGSHDECDDDR